MAQQTAQVTVSGTPENPVFNFVLPTGAKGEPGGWNIGTNLGTLDLNTITAPGIYYQGSTTNALNAALHYPLMTDYAGSVRGVLTVKSWSGGTAVIQEYTRIGRGSDGTNHPRVTYTRYNEGTDKWSPWTPFISLRVDNAAGRVVYMWDEQANREQMIYSDTGWRDISANLITDNFILNPSQPRCLIRREGSDVHLMMRLQASASLIASGQGKSLTLLPALDIPAGFTEGPISYALTMTGVFHAGGTIEALAAGPTHTNAQLRIAGTTDKPWTANGVLGFNLRWKTNAVWPTSLPGTAA